MATRKKKTEVDVAKNTETPVEQPNTKQVVANDGLGIQYQGTVTVALQHGKNIIKKKEYKNSGTTNLFKFICEALAGNYKTGLRPCRIRGYSKGDDQANNPSTWTFDDAHGVTPYITYETTAIAASESKTDTNSYNVIFTFKIPYAFISGNIAKVALYPATVNNAADDICAKFGFVNESGWNEINLSDDEFKQGNYCILLEWKMTLSNKPATTKAN